MRAVAPVEVKGFRQPFAQTGNVAGILTEQRGGKLGIEDRQRTGGGPMTESLAPAVDAGVWCAPATRPCSCPAS